MQLPVKLELTQKVSDKTNKPYTVLLITYPDGATDSIFPDANLQNSVNGALVRYLTSIIEKGGKV